MCAPKTTPNVIDDHFDRMAGHGSRSSDVQGGCSRLLEKTYDLKSACRQLPLIRRWSVSALLLGAPILAELKLFT